jgi:hypothetical protein
MPIKVRNGANGAALYYHNVCYPTTNNMHAFSSHDGKYCYAPDGDGVRWMKTRNNIFIADADPYYVSKRRLGMRYNTLDFDYNCLVKINGDKPSPIRIDGEKHSIFTMPAFIDAVKGDLRLKDDEQECIDKGEIIKGINDEVPEQYQYKGEAPDIGVYEYGVDLPHYGPRF